MKPVIWLSFIAMGAGISLPMVVMSLQPERTQFETAVSPFDSAPEATFQRADWDDGRASTPNLTIDLIPGCSEAPEEDRRFET